MTNTFNLQENFEKLKPNLGITDSKVGEMIIYRNDSIVSAAIALFGEYCDAEIQIMSRYLDKDSVYLDIGTNIGYHALGVHKTVGCAVMGFEPHPDHFTVAAYNCRDKNIRLYNTALGNKNGTMTISTFNDSETSNYGEVGVNDEGIEVSQIKLDELDELGVVTLMKIDVEGFELEVLKGATKTIKEQRPVIFYEAIDFDVWNKCYKWLDSKDYKQYWVTCRTKPLAPTYKETDVNPFGFGGVSNILAVPIEKDQPQDLLEVVPNQPFGQLLERFSKLKLLF